MKKPLLIVIIILAVILALPVINLLRWTFQSKKPMDVVIVNKTVPTIEREKHKSLTWILTNDRVVKKEKKSSYSTAKDYYGFVPTRPIRDRLWEKNEYRLVEVIDFAEKSDAVYFADTYGVFMNEWYQSISRVRRSRKLYGGLNNTDNLLIKEMKDRNKLVILEYNAFDYPTAEYEAYRIQERLGIKYTGWTGKYFATLDTVGNDFPIWMTAMYRRQYKQPWKFSKPGIVLLRDKAIMVLEEGTHLTKAMPEILTDSLYRERYQLPESVPFDQWFDIIDPMENKVISNIKLSTTALGDSILNQYEGVSSVFPAVVTDPVAERTYYFSGDFTNADIPVWSARFKGVEKLKGILYSSKPEDTRRFFWLYYKPLISGIFNEYYNSISAE
jgi:hypothetical protein